VAVAAIKVALQVDAAVMLSNAVASVPLQLPDHPANVDPLAAVAVSVTLVPDTNEAEHVVPQMMPVGDEVTLPLPVPNLVTCSVYEANVASVNVAVHEALAVSVTLVVAPVPVHAPDQPVKVAPNAGLAVIATVLPDANDALQVLPQLMPVGEEVTDPAPVPALTTVNVTGGGATAVCALNMALQVVRERTITVVDVVVPLQSPLQPAKVDPASAVAVRLIDVPLLYREVQSLPQLIPAGDDVTLPVPLPLLVTVSRYDAAEACHDAVAMRSKVVPAIKRPARRKVVGKFTMQTPDKCGQNSEWSRCPLPAPVN
jgi:hypothetical protein